MTQVADAGQPHTSADEPCIESKLLALHTSTVCLARVLAQAGVLDREAFRQELLQGRAWLAHHDHCGHNVESFDALLDMLMNV